MGGYRGARPRTTVAGCRDRVPGLGEREMKNSYLEVTFRHGRPLAAYLYLARSPSDKSYRTKRAPPGFLIDFNHNGDPIRIEITAPAKLPAVALDGVFRHLRLP